MSNQLLRENIASRLARVPAILRRIDDLQMRVAPVQEQGYRRINTTWLIHNLWNQGYQIDDLAAEFGCHRHKITRLINGYCKDPELRQKLAAKVNRSVRHVFGND